MRGVSVNVRVTRRCMTQGKMPFVSVEGQGTYREWAAILTITRRPDGEGFDL